MLEYAVSARSYLGRAKQLLASSPRAHLFYAALELRCGVEARLREYLEPHTHVPSGKKSDWRVASLGKTADRAFQTGTKVARVKLIERKTNLVVGTYYYTPVSPELRKLAEKLGDYLHAGKEYRPPEDPWWDNMRTNLEIAAQLLEDATFGTLLGPPLTNRKTGRLHLPIELLEGRDESMPPKIGTPMTLDIRYFPSLADARHDAV